MDQESLIQQYKRCTKHNQEQLKQAKNIEDLVNIKIETINKELINNDNTYNYQYDPVYFRQKVPCMGDRNFLINQAILLKSSQKQRAATKNEYFNSGLTTKRDLTHFAHAGLDMDSLGESTIQQLQDQQEKLKQSYVQNHEIDIENIGDKASNDPVQILKQIFKRKQYQKKPLDSNPIANKYRQQYLQDMKKEKKRQQMNLLNQKQFKEDQDQMPMKDELMDSKIVREETPMRNGQDYYRYGGVDQNDQNLGIKQQKDGLTLKERLENMRKMFEDEENLLLDLNDENGNDYMDLDNKIQKNVSNTKQRSKNIHSQDTSLNPSENEDDDLKDFLTNRIKEIKKRMNHQDPNFDKALQQSQKYKASTLSKIQAVRLMGSEKLEDQFKNRMNKTGVDLAFKNALINYDKKVQKQISTENERGQEILAEHKRHTMTAPKRQRDAMSSSQGYKSAKDRNYVFAQIMKIEKINKEFEKKNKEKRDEIKNKDIEQIIQTTKQEMQEKDRIEDHIWRQQEFQQQQEYYVQLLRQQQAAFSQSILEENQSEEMRQDIKQEVQITKIISKTVSQNQSEKQIITEYMAASKEEIKEGDSLRDGIVETGTLQGDEGSVEEGSKSTNYPNAQSKQQMRHKYNQGSVVSNTNNNNTNNNNNHQNFRKSMQDAQILFNKTELNYFTDSEVNMRRSFGNRFYQNAVATKIRKQNSSSSQRNEFEASINTIQLVPMPNPRSKNRVYREKTVLQPIQEDSNNPSKVSKYENFSPRRFNRYPRFTIFLKKGENTLTNKYILENTISLNPQFLNYLLESQVNNTQIEQLHETQKFIEEQQKEQGIIIRNEKSDQVQKIDPFEKVILVKGIDNSILTSFRTLRKQNNLVSDTLKVIHNKFQPQPIKNSFYMIMSKNHADKMPYPLTDNEEAIEMATAKILAENYRIQFDVGVGNSYHNEDLMFAEDSKNKSGIKPSGNSVESVPEGQEQETLLMREQSRGQMIETQLMSQIGQIQTQNVNTARAQSGILNKESNRSNTNQRSLNKNKTDQRSKFEVKKRNSHVRVLQNRKKDSNQSNMINEYNNFKKNTMFQQDSRQYTANQDSQLESQEDNAFLSDVIQGQKYNTKVFNLIQPQQNASMYQQSLLVTTSPGQPSIQSNVNNNGSNSIQEPPQKIQIQTKFKKPNNNDLENEPITFEESNKPKKEVMVISKVNPFAAFPEQSPQTYQLQPNALINPMNKTRQVFQSVHGKRQIVSDARSLPRVSQDGRSINTATSSLRKSRFDFNKKPTQEPLSKSINFKQQKMGESLPPLMQNQQSVQQYQEMLNNEYSSTRFRQNNNQLPLNNVSKIKQVIDDIYSKEKKYIKQQYVREDFIQPQSAIFNLNKYHNIQTTAQQKPHLNNSAMIIQDEHNKNMVNKNIMIPNQYDYINTDIGSIGLGAGSSTYKNSVMTNDFLLFGNNI